MSRLVEKTQTDTTLVEKTSNSRLVEKPASRLTPIGSQVTPTATMTKLNDPYQLNTVLDAIFNTAGLKKAYGSADLASRFKAIKDITLNQYINPVLKGSFNIAGMNTLVGLGEVLDVFANPIKGLAAPLIDRTINIDPAYAKLVVDAVDNKQVYSNTQLNGRTLYTFFDNGVPKSFTDEELDTYRNIVNSGNTVNISKLTTWERVKASVGVGKYGHINFQANTGDKCGDVVMELLLDPETWVTLGGSAAASIAKNGADKGLRVFAKHLDDLTQTVEDLGMREELRQLSVNLVNDSARKNLATKITKMYREGEVTALKNDTTTNALFKNYISDVVKSDSIHNTYKIKTIQDATNAALIASGRPALAFNEQVVQEAIHRGMTKHVNKMTTTVLSALDVGNKVIDKTQGVLLKSALTPTGVFPVWAIAKKTPAVAKFVKNTLQSAEELYNGPNGYRRMTSFFDAAYNKERTTQTITDALSDDLKVLYREPDYIRPYEKSALKDITYIDNWYRNLNDENFEQQMKELTDYISTQHKTDLEGLIESVNSIVKTAAQSSTVLKQYADTLQNISEDMKYFIEYAKNNAKIKTVRNVTDILSSSSLNGVILTHLNDSIVSLNKLFTTSQVGITAHQFEKALIESAEKTLSNIELVLSKIAELGPDYEAVMQMAMARYKELFDTYIEQTLTDLYHMTAGIGVLPASKYIDMLNSIRDNAEDFMREYFTATGDFNHNVTELLSKINSTWYYNGRPANVLDGIQQIKQANNARSQAIIKKLDKHGILKADTENVSEAELVKIRAAKRKVQELSMPVSMLPTGRGQEQCDKVLDLIQKLTSGGRSDKFGLFIHSADEYDLSVPQDKLMQYSYDSLEYKMMELMVTPSISAEYAGAYNEVTNILNNLVTAMLKKFGVENAEKYHVNLIQDFLDDLQTYCMPSHVDSKKELIESYEATFRMKEESFTSLLNILNDKDVNDVVDAVRTGPFGNLVKDIIGNNLYSEEVQENAKSILALVNSFESTRNFVYRSLMADIRPETREALLASVMNYWWLSPESFKEHQAFWADAIVERMPNFTQYTQQGMRRHNLNKLMQEEEFKDSIKKVYDAAGEKMPDNELHQALSDAIASAGVLFKLAEQNADLAKAIKDKVVIHIDSEAMNATTKAMTNQMHQIAYLVTKNDTVLHKYSQSVSPEDIMGDSGYDFMPTNEYQLGLYDMAQHKTDGTYAPVSDYTQVSADKMQAFYLKHLSEGNTVEEAANADKLVLDSMYNLYKQLVEYAPYNEETKTFEAVLDGHNIKGFDLAYIKNICSSHKLYARAANEKEYGFDLHFIDNLEVIDTLEQVKIEDFTYRLTSAEETSIRKLLFEYADSLEGNSYAKLFTAFNTADIRRIKNLITTVQDNPGKALNPFVAEGMQISAPNEFAELLQQLAKAKETVVEIYKNNKCLAEQSYYASTVTGVKYREYWLNFFRNELKLEEDEITRRFGKDASNLQLSSLFAAAGEYADYAFKPELQPKLQDAWWIGTLTRTQAGDFTREEAVAQAKITAALNTYQKEAKNYEVYTSYYNDMRKAVDAILDTGDFNYMRYIRTNGLNVSEQYALFRYLTNKVHPDQLKNVLMTNMTPKQADSLIALLQVGRKYSDVSEDRYLNMFNDVEDKKTIAYMAMLDDNMALRRKFEDMSQLQDNNGLVGSAATLQIKAMEPLYNVLTDLTTNLKAISPVERVKFYNAEMDLTNELGRQITKRFADASAEDTLKWLAHNHAHVVLDMYSFKTLDEYELFINKLNSKEFTDLNIHNVVDGATVWVYLPRKANLRLHKNLKTGEKFVNVNGQNIENFAHPAFKAEDMSGTYNGMVNTELMQKAMDAIDFMTEGACRGSTYEMYGQNAFRKLYNKMPEEMQKEFYSVDELSSPLFWDSTPYNYSILGTLTNKRNLGIGTSGQFLSSLRNATEYRMNEHGMRLVYTQAMFSDANALQNTAIGNIIAEHPEDALRYFKSNPDYTIAVLVPDKQSKWGYRVEECDVNSKLGLQNALLNNGKVVSYSEFEKLYEVINTNVVSETKLAVWQKIVRMFKIGYLVNPGTWMRNSVDAFMKNMQTAESDMVASYATAFKDIKDYDEIVRQLNGLGGGHFPLPGVVKRYFDGKDVLMDYDKFMKLHAFFSDPAAGSEAKLYTDLNRASREKYLTQLMSADQITTDEYNHQMARSTYNHLTNALLTPMNGIERVSRLACYQQLTRQGLTNASALRMVEKTHFAYSTKSKFEQTMELLVPFYTFTSRNFTYWMDAMENNPAYFAIMRDVLEPALNLEQYSQEEREGNASVQRSILSGNINVIDDYYWSLNLSFMDSLKWLSNPIGQAKGQIFSPVQAIVNVYLQHASDEAYHSGKAALSSWLEESFGLDMTEQQIRDKYQAWADEYMKLYSWKVSSEDPVAELLKWKTIEQFIPMIGSQIQRMETTGVYLNDGDGLKALLYLTGVAGKTTRWAPAPSSETKDLNSALYNLLSADEGGWNKYNQLCRVLGYEGDKISELPNPVKQTILAMLTDQVPDYNVLPVLQDSSAMNFMWTALKTKYDVSGVSFADIPKDKLQSMYKEIAESTVTIANIYDMLDQDELSRISYSVVKKNLGLTGLKIYQMPIEALGVLEAAMKAHLYAAVRTPQTYGSSYRRYAKKTYTGAESPGYFAGYDGVTPYDTTKGVYANYGQNWAQKQGKHNYLDFYRDMYGANGTNKMQMNMYKISPKNFKYRMKDMFYYYK